MATISASVGSVAAADVVQAYDAASQMAPVAAPDQSPGRPENVVGRVVALVDPVVAQLGQQAVEQNAVAQPNAADNNAPAAQSENAIQANILQRLRVVIDLGKQAHAGIEQFVMDYPLIAIVMFVASVVFGVSQILPAFLATLLTGLPLCYLAYQIGATMYNRSAEFNRRLEEEVRHGLGVHPARRQAELHAQHIVQHIQGQAAAAPAVEV